MATGFILLLVFTAVISTIVGVLIGRSNADRRYKQDTKYTQGTLNVYSDPELGPGMYVALAISLDDIASRKYVTFDVNAISQNSHK